MFAWPERLVAGLIAFALAGCLGGSGGGDGDSATVFAKSYGGPLDDEAHFAIETADGGYAFLGTRALESGEWKNDTVPWLVKLDANGNVEWQFTLDYSAGIGGSLGMTPSELVVKAVSGGGYCVTGRVAGQPGDPGDVYVARLDADVNLLWETRFDSGGWGGHEIIAAGNRGAFAYDRGVDAVVGPDGSCIVAAASFAHLRAGAGGIENEDGTVHVDPGLTYLDARSLVVARVDETGPRWIRRETRGAFNRPSFEDGSAFRFTMIPTGAGGAALAYLVEEGLNAEGDAVGGVQLVEYDSAGSPELIHYHSPTGNINRETVRMKVDRAIVVTEFDNPGGEDGFFVGLGRARPSVATSDDSPTRARIYRVNRDGRLVWDTGPVGEGESSIAAFALFAGIATHCTPDRRCFAAPFGSAAVRAINDDLTLTNLIRFYDADDGTFVSESQDASFGPYQGLLGLEGSRYRAVVGAHSEGNNLRVLEYDTAPAVVQDFDLAVPQLLVASRPLSADDRRRALPLADGVYRFDRGFLRIERDDGSADSYLLSNAGARRPRGLVEMAPGLLAVAVGQGDGGHGGALLLVRDGEITGQRVFATGDVDAEVHGVGSRAEGGATILVGHRRADIGLFRWDGNSGRALQLITLAADGSIVGESEVFDSLYLGLVFPPAEIHETADGDFVVLFPITGGIFRIGSGGVVQYAREYSTDGVKTSGGIDVTADDGLIVLDGMGFNQLFTLQRLEANGDVRWQRHYRLPPGEGVDHLRSDLEGSVRALPDGGYAVALTTRGILNSGFRTAGSVPPPEGETNIALMRLADDGTPEWLRVYGGLYFEAAASLELTGDGGFLIAGSSDSLGQPSVETESLNRDAWILRLGADGRVDLGCNAFLAEFPGFLIDVRTPDDVSQGWVLDEDEIRVEPIDYAMRDGAEYTAVTPQIVEARQCVAQAATMDAPAAPVETRRLTVRQSGSISGLVLSTPGGIFCGGADPQVCERDFGVGYLATLIVDDSSATQFRGWGGLCEEIRTNPHRCLVRMNSDQIIDATFEPADGSLAMLTVDVTGAGRVRATQPGGIDCRDDSSTSDCVQTYALGQRVDLVASNDPGEEFIGWGGDCIGFGTAATARIALDMDRTCTATFSGVGAPERHTLDVAVTQDGQPPTAQALGGRVLSTPPGIDCGLPGSDCSADYLAGESVSLLAQPAAGFGFAGWTSGDAGTACDGATANPVNVTMDGARHCTAEFVTAGSPSERILGVTVSGNGRIDSNPPGIACLPDCLAAYPLNSTVTLVASGTATSPFERWTGDCAGGGINVAVTMNTDKQCTAIFGATAGTVRLTITVIGSGSVTTADGGIACPGDCIEDYPTGANVTVSAVPAAGSTLQGWSGDCFDLADSRDFILNMFADRSCTATFVP